MQQEKEMTENILTVVSELAAARCGIRPPTADSQPDRSINHDVNLISCYYLWPRPILPDMDLCVS